MAPPAQPPQWSSRLPPPPIERQSAPTPASLDERAAQRSGPTRLIGGGSSCKLARKARNGSISGPEAPRLAPGAGQLRGADQEQEQEQELERKLERERELECEFERQELKKEERRRQEVGRTDRTMLVKASVLSARKTLFCRRRLRECDRSRQITSLAGDALDNLEKSNGHHEGDGGGDQHGRPCCPTTATPPADCLRGEAAAEEFAEAPAEGRGSNQQTSIERANGGQRKRRPQQARRLEACTWQQCKPSSSSSSSDNQRCSAWMRVAELVFIYIIITSSVAVVLSPASATHYWPLRSRALAHQQHQHQHQRQQQFQQFQQQEPQTSVLVGAPTALAAPAITAVESSESEESLPPSPPPASKALPTGSPRGPLMIGQHYNNFSSIVPYSVLSDSDADYAGAGAAQEDQLLDELPEGEPLGQQLGQQQQQQLDEPAGLLLKSRALLPLDSSRLGLPQMQQIKSRFNQGCVGGTKCQFFAFCWMSGGSLGASCGLLMTCCVTPSRQEIQPGFYGPVVNDPCK